MKKINKLLGLLLAVLFIFVINTTNAQVWEKFSTVRNKDGEVTRVTNHTNCMTEKIEQDNNYNITRDWTGPCLYTLTLRLKWSPDALQSRDDIPNNLNLSLWLGTTMIAQVPVINNVATFEDIPGNSSYDVKVTSGSLPNYTPLDASILYAIAIGNFPQTFFKLRATDTNKDGVFDGSDNLLLQQTITNNYPQIIDPYELLDPSNLPASHFDTYQMSIMVDDNIDMEVNLLARGFLKY